MSRPTQNWRRRFTEGALVFAYAPGVAQSAPSLTRASTATYSATTVEPFFAYTPASGLTSATFSRASTATYTREA